MSQSKVRSKGLGQIQLRVACVAGVSKTSRKGNETGRECEKKKTHANERNREGVRKYRAEGWGEAREGSFSPHPLLSLLPHPLPTSPQFLPTPGVLLRSPAFSLACSISEWKRKGNGCYAGKVARGTRCLHLSPAMKAR